MHDMQGFIQVERAEDLTRPETLERVVGPVSTITIAPLQTTGFSGSEHKLVKVLLQDGATRRFILKRTPLQTDWTYQLSSSSRAREAALLDTPQLRGVWQVFKCPYVYFAECPNETALLMEDLTPFLLPDVKEPLSELQEELILAALARMHATYWQSEILEHSWLSHLSAYWSVLGPERAGQEAALQLFPARMRESFRHGWQLALRLLPKGVVETLSVSGEEMERRWSHLPMTLVHGDVKVANFAIHADGGISAFDWALVGRAPVSSDLGWYLAVNASRLARPKETFVVRYREILERELQVALDNKLWEEIVAAAILIGARMLLWSKANALDSGGRAARIEWDWWVRHLEAVCT